MYFPLEISLKKSYKNPFRNDKNAGCRFYYNKSGTLLFRDPSNKIYGGDCFSVVMLARNCNFKEALDHISRDFKIGQNRTEFKRKVHMEHNIVQDKDRTIIIPEPYLHTPVPHLNYWKSMDISKNETDIFHVYPLQGAIYKKGDEEYYESYISRCVFYYIHDNGYTVYQPFASKKKRFKKSVPHDTLQGEEGLSYFKQIDKLIVTKSLKDTICLFKLGFPSISLHSECAYLPDFLIEKIESYCKDIYLLYDNDKTGIDHSKILCEQTKWKNIKLSCYNDSASYMVKGLGEELKLELNHIMSEEQ